MNPDDSSVQVRLARAEQRADLVRLAAEPDDQHAREIRVLRVSAERAPQDLHALALRVHAATRAVRQRDDAVHIRVVGQALGREAQAVVARLRAEGRVSIIMIAHNCRIGKHNII